MGGPTVNSFPAVTAAHALEAPEIQHSAQQLIVRVSKNQHPTLSISAGKSPPPRVENNGDRGTTATSSPSGDRELFLDEFDTDNNNNHVDSNEKVVQRNVGKGKASPSSSSRFETVRIVPDHSSSKAWAADGLIKLSATRGEAGSLSVKVSMSKKRPLPFVSVENQGQEGREEEQEQEKEEEDPEKWSRDEFMASTRSASQQASIEFGVQVAWGLKFAAGRVHSMIRCSEQIQATYPELANEFLAVIAEEKDAEPA